MKIWCVYIHLYIYIFTYGWGANILGIIPMPSYSHQVFFHPLWKELSLKGHQVTVITTNPMNNSKLTNLTEINVHDIYSILDWNMFEAFDQPTWKVFFDYNEVQVKIIDQILSNSQVKRLINDNTVHFDLVMLEIFHTAAYAFVPKFKCPLILLSSLDGSHFVYKEIGNTAHPILHPDYMLHLSKYPSFFERLRSVCNNMIVNIIQNYLLIPSQQLLVKKHFGEGYPLIQDIFKNYSACFVNTNNFMHPIRPLLPNIIQIGGGTHLSEQSPLPHKLKKILDDANKGFIYFSLGTNVKSVHLTDMAQKEILDTFRELPYTVLWKFESENIHNIPQNVLIAKWFPQQDIFRHPNIKLFITQGGLQSLEEAIYNHIPIIGIPVMADQGSNIVNIVSKGLGLSLKYEHIKKELLKPMILEVIKNPMYRNNVKDAATFLRDQPRSGLDKALWWTEYVLRHKGAPLLRNPGIDLPFYQEYLLDIYGFLILVLAITVYLLKMSFKLILKTYRCLRLYFKVKVE